MRLDVYLTASCYAKSRSYAAELIKKGLVKVSGVVVTKPSFETDGVGVEVTGELYPFVGRGGVKLEAALASFGIDIAGKVCVDVGASTGGFTDCLLRRGAAKVYAVDSGHGQLDGTLAKDRRVVNLEGVNAKELSNVIEEECSVCVCDVSFISQTLLIPEIVKVLSDSGVFVTLIKPQFEVGKGAVGKGGIVKDKKSHADAIIKVADAALACGLKLLALIPSPVPGGDGNREFLAYFSRVGEEVSRDIVKEVTK